MASCDRAYDQSCDCRSTIIHNWWFHHAQLVVRSRELYLRPLTIWNRRFEVLNMTIDIAATDFALAITHDLCDQSYVLSANCPRFQHFSVAPGSKPGRKPGVTGACTHTRTDTHTDADTCTDTRIYTHT